MEYQNAIVVFLHSSYDQMFSLFRLRNHLVHREPSASSVKAVLKTMLNKQWVTVSLQMVLSSAYISTCELEIPIQWKVVDVQREKYWAQN